MAKRGAKRRRRGAAGARLAPGKAAGPGRVPAAPAGEPAPGTAPDRGGFPGTPAAIVLLVLAALGVTLPFIFRAFHQDDTIFVWLAQQKLHDPLALGLPNHAYEGNFFPLYLDTHPPLITSYLSLLIRLCGGAREACLHLGFIVFPALAAVSMFFLARRFTACPLTAALLLVATPGFMVMSQSVMTDGPTLALWLAATAAFVAGVDRGAGRYYWLAAVFISLAVLTTYQSISLVPLLFLYLLLQRRIGARSLIPLEAGLAVFAAIFAYYLIRTGGPPKLSYSIGVPLTPGFITSKVVAELSVIGGATVFPAALAAGLLKGKKEYAYFAALAAGIFLVYLSKLGSGQYTLLTAALQAAFLSVGVLAVYRYLDTAVAAAASGRWSGRDRDDVFLAVWIGGVLFYCVALLPYASTRYSLLLFPPVVLMLVRHARAAITGNRRWRVFAVAAIALTAITGLGVSLADYQLAGVYPEMAAAQAAPLAASGHRVWFAGEFGLRYYLQAGGATYLTRTDNSPAPGDYVILSHSLIAHFISDALWNRLQLERQVAFPSRWPVRVEDPGSQAGFYDQFHGTMPWSLSGDPVEVIDIYRVK